MKKIDKEVVDKFFYIKVTLLAISFTGDQKTS